MLLLDRIAYWAMVAPGRRAIVSPDEHLSYGELWQQSAERSQQLHDPFLAVIGHKSPDMVVSFIAALIADIPFVPIDSELTPIARQERILHTFEEHLAPPGTAYIIFTSGSTGDPKGVMVPREALDAFIDSTITVHDLPSAERWLNVAPWSFDLSVLDTWVGLATGGTVVTVSRSLLDNPGALQQFLELNPVDNWVSTPTFADYCLSLARFTSTEIQPPRRFFFCGEVLRPSTVRALYERFPDSLVYNMYGPTEACCAVTSTLVTPKMASSNLPLSCGKPYPTIDIVIDHGDDTRPYDPGEVMLMGPQVAWGYLGTQSDKFAVQNGRRSYRTGDLGYIAHGELQVCGRIDRQVKVHGYRVELAEIERTIRGAGAYDAAVVQMPDGSLTAFVRQVTGSKIRDRLRHELPSYMIPKRIVRLDDFPRTANGKVDLLALKKMG